MKITVIGTFNLPRVIKFKFKFDKARTNNVDKGKAMTTGTGTSIKKHLKLIFHKPKKKLTRTKNLQHIYRG